MKNQPNLSGKLPGANCTAGMTNQHDVAEGMATSMGALTTGFTGNMTNTMAQTALA